MDDPIEAARVARDRLISALKDVHAAVETLTEIMDMKPNVRCGVDGCPGHFQPQGGGPVKPCHPPNTSGY